MGFVTKRRGRECPCYCDPDHKIHLKSVCVCVCDKKPTGVERHSMVGSFSVCVFLKFNIFMTLFLGIHSSNEVSRFSEFMFLGDGVLYLVVCLLLDQLVGL